MKRAVRSPLPEGGPSVPFAKFVTTRGGHCTNFASDKDTSKPLTLV